ncbi:MAG: DoxX family protein [Chloroflexi bacterium]|nr:DoxX family protein [Chloroflexota bacterium]
MLTGLALLALRIGVGVELLVHGWPKIKNPASVTGFMEQLGMKPGIFWAWIAALVEFLGGIALILGLLTRPAAFFVTIEFLIIAFYLKPKKMKVPFTTAQAAGWEWDWLIMMMGLALLLAGSGTYGLDRVLNLPF